MMFLDALDGVRMEAVPLGRREAGTRYRIAGLEELVEAYERDVVTAVNTGRVPWPIQEHCDCSARLGETHRSRCKAWLRMARAGR